MQKKEGEHSFPSLRLINFVLHMYKELTSEQRYTISVLLQKKCSLSFIAKTIGVCVSTVSREKRRNSNVQGVCMTSVWQRWKPGVARLLKGSGLPVRTITTDNGTEFAAHEIIARELGTTVYFAPPYCSWEKGAIENMNGLAGQYIPKRTNFREISRGYVRKIVEKLNNRPRKKKWIFKASRYD